MNILCIKLKTTARLFCVLDHHDVLKGPSSRRSLWYWRPLHTKYIYVYYNSNASWVWQERELALPKLITWPGPDVHTGLVGGHQLHHVEVAVLACPVQTCVAGAEVWTIYMSWQLWILPQHLGHHLVVSLSGLNPPLLDAGGVHGVLVVWHDAATDVYIVFYHVFFTMFFLNRNTIFSFGKFKFSDVNLYLLLNSMVI